MSDKVTRLVHGARFDSPEGFEAFFKLIFRMELLPHWRKGINQIYDHYAADLGSVIEAARGQAKTTTITVAYMAFRVGHAPENSHMLIQLNDEAASDTSGAIASIIEYNPLWKLIFPHVEPDKLAGWSATGYDVKAIHPYEHIDVDGKPYVAIDTNSTLPYEEWRQKALQGRGRDPSFFGMGYKSRAIIGRRATGMLVIDDIHDENNTVSERELEKVRKIYTGTILPTIVPGTWNIIVGTPWTKNDILADMKAIGEEPGGYGHVYIPAKEPTKLPIDEENDTFTWPERFGAHELTKRLKASGELEFARMYLLDLEAAEGVHLKREWLHEYPVDQIKPSWPTVIGVDYASTADEWELKSKTRDYFALAVGRLIPGGGIVIQDGFQGHVSQGEAEALVKAWAARFPTLMLIGIEAVGKGEEFYHLMHRNSALPVMPCTTGNKSKGARFEKQMAPLFQFSRAWLSDEPNPFLKAFKREWVEFPQGLHDDTLDAVYYALYVGQPNMLQMTEADQEIVVTNPMHTTREEEPAPVTFFTGNR